MVSIDFCWIRAQRCAAFLIVSHFTPYHYRMKAIVMHFLKSCRDFDCVRDVNNVRIKDRGRRS